MREPVPNLYKYYRKVVPIKNYHQCNGCHAGKKLCPAVTNLHKFCPCSNCLVKVRCSTYCKDYLMRFKVAIEMNKRINFLEFSEDPGIFFKCVKKKRKLIIRVKMILNKKSTDGNKSLSLTYDDLTNGSFTSSRFI